jgi:CheY-like chemotaxis protein
MVFDSFQARQLYCAEGLELCQQIKEELLILAHAPTLLMQQKLVQRVHMLQEGALHLGLIDIELLTRGLDLLLETYGDRLAQASVVHELLYHLCDGLQLSFIAYGSLTEPTSTLSQRDFVLHSLMPKGLEIFDLVFTGTLQETLQTQLLMQQLKWIQFWSQSLHLADLNLVTGATLSAFEAFPQSVIAIAPVAMAGLQVAYETTLRASVESFDSAHALPSSPLKRYPSEQALDVFDTSHHLVGITGQAIFCVATESIEEIVLYETSQILRNHGHEEIIWGDRQLRLHRFIDLWQPNHSQNAVKSEKIPSFTILILKYEAQPYAIALEVERLIVEPSLQLNWQESVSIPQRCCYGSAALSDGVPMEVLDINCCLSEYLAQQNPVTSARLMGSATARPLSLPLQKTILVVDDSRTVREMLTLTLKGAGYDVVQAQDGQQAIEHLENQTNANQAAIHLTICDLEMSNLNGFEFLRYRLQDPRWCQIPVVILSSHTEDEYRQLSQKLGAANYFTIPYDESFLIESIERLLTHDINP